MSKIRPKRTKDQLIIDPILTILCNNIKRLDEENKKIKEENKKLKSENINYQRVKPKKSEN